MIEAAEAEVTQTVSRPDDSRGLGIVMWSIATTIAVIAMLIAVTGWGSACDSDGGGSASPSPQLVTVLQLGQAGHQSTFKRRLIQAGKHLIPR